MDQNKTDIPHIITNPKALAGIYRLETHITGVQAHGHCTFMLIDCGPFSHNTNLTIEAAALSSFKGVLKMYIPSCYLHVNL